MHTRIARNTSTSYSPNEHRSYTVVSGDNLHHIAQRFGVSFEALLAHNPQIRDPSTISPGQQITLPLPPRGVQVVSTSASHPTSTVSIGDRGGQVRDLQSRLNAAGFSIGPVDGVFGPKTRRAVIRFQRSVGLSQDGIAGPDTQRALLTRAHEPPGTPAPSGSTRTSNETRPAPFPVMSRGSSGPQVRTLQEQLHALGFDAGPVDGDFGPKTQYAVQRFQTSQGLSPDGIVGNQTMSALLRPSATRTTPAPRLPVYPPHSPEAIALFREAASVAGVPTSWATSNGLHQILSRESGGRVGVPNYTYGRRAQDPGQWPEIWSELRNGTISARSSATGLGQLLLNNVDTYYPNGRSGIGNAVEEAAGMLNYIQARYGNPEQAWRSYGRMGFEGY